MTRLLRVLAGGAWTLLGLLPAASAQVEEAVPVSPLMADRYVAGVGGPVEAHLDAQKGWRLEAVTVAGRRYAAGEDFPTFLVLDKQGQRHALPAQDARWQAERVAQSAVRYSAHGLSVELRYAPDRDRLHVVAKVLSEGDWKLIALSGTPLSRSVPSSSVPSPVTRHPSPDYIVDGSGWLVFPDVPKATERKWDANSDNLIGGATTAAFVGWREPDRIVFLKPLTFSHWLGWWAKPNGAACQLALRTGLYFRPPETKLFETKLCHEALALRIETAGDMNGDGDVDWVDAGIAYRERYIKPHKGECFRQRLRGAFRVYHQVFAFPNYDAAFAGLPQIDFADGIWWCKGVMAFLDDRDSEAHPFTVKPHPKLGDLGPSKKAMTDARQWT
ncbi:MAG: hypothetical protein FJ278_22420, partial [Planctomycetes bacterium]|nr:hypothetical protein [Planctomycetota bacterium]